MRTYQLNLPHEEPARTGLGTRPAGAGPAPAGRAARATINGRFLSQPKTGVQRYAYEIVRQMDAILAEDPLLRSHLTLEIVAPERATGPADYAAIRRRGVGGGKGYGWEQGVLPLRARAPLLNLCNTAPLLRRRQIVCIHGANSFVYPQSYSRRFRYAQRALFPAIGRRAQTITTVSNASAKLLKSLGIVPADADVDVIPNGHEHVRAWRPEATKLDRAAILERPYVLVIGSQAPHKNVRMLDAISGALNARGIKLLVTGGVFDMFSSRAARLDAPETSVLGYVTDDDLAFLLANALCLAFPSLVEGFGLPLVEAMALGCPIVSSNVASMPEVCGNAAILLPPDRPEQWLEAIQGLHDSPSLRADLGARGAKQVRRFSWAASAQAYIDLLLDATGGPCRPL
ncbi:glycosyltransferase family 1 protein [Methylobacterium durans]|uniref:glycosyltransferase family 4 protein n=1 Tax=Methylobacterium durans TaxID=2202825 RepID=UPI002AFEEE4D|nr:glycosyltransferase family 1 protein [Methylobacterium durans]MEA1832106.1 glycosyltransferase family 1 protein [Methylobacterium durans]